MRQLEHKEIVNQKLNSSVKLFLNGVQSVQNVGLIWRTCEIMGIKTIYNNKGFNLNNSKLKKISRGAFKTVQLIPIQEELVLIKRLKESGSTIIGLEITDESIFINKFDFHKVNDIVLVVGSEKKGISSYILDVLDFSVSIPMYGKISSMNVANSVAIALYEITKQQILKK